MISESEPYSREAHIRRFNENLATAVEKGEVSFCGSWLDEQTLIALREVAAAFPDPDPAVIAEARAAFGRQLDGTHAAERQAEWDAWAGAYGSTWPQTPFAQAVTAAFQHVLRFIEHPAEYEETDAARTELDAAQAQSAGDSHRERIIGQLRAMIGELDVIPDYEIPIPNRRGETEEFAACAERAFRQLAKAAEGEPDAQLRWVPVELNRAARCRPPSTRWRRDFGIILERLSLILAGFATDRPDT